MLTLSVLENPSVSVIVPVNEDRFLDQAVASLLWQTRLPDEIVIIRDGAVSRRDYAMPGGVSLVWLSVRERPTPAGPAHTRNVGLREASGSIVLFQDADDLSLPHRIAWSVDQLRTGEVGLACGSVIVVGPGAEPALSVECQSFSFDRHSQDNGVPTGSVALRREALADVGLFRDDLAVAEDYDLWLRVSERYRVAHSSAPLYLYRSWPGSLTARCRQHFPRCMGELFAAREARLAAGTALR